MAVSRTRSRQRLSKQNNRPRIRLPKKLRRSRIRQHKKPRRSRIRLHKKLRNRLKIMLTKFNKSLILLLLLKLLLQIQLQEPALLTQDQAPQPPLNQQQHQLQKPKLLTQEQAPLPPLNPHQLNTMTQCGLMKMVSNGSGGSSFLLVSFS